VERFGYSGKTGRTVDCRPSVHIPREADRGTTLAACNSLSFLVAARGASAAFGGFGFALKTAATFDVSYWLQVTNYGVLYVLFDSAPSGSNYIDVWDLCLHAQTASTIISSQPFSDESRRKQAEKLFDRVRKSCTRNQSPIAIRPFLQSRQSPIALNGCLAPGRRSAVQYCFRPNFMADDLAWFRLPQAAASQASKLNGIIP